VKTEDFCGVFVFGLKVYPREQIAEFEGKIANPLGG
jgi:hypothetical protein